MNMLEVLWRAYSCAISVFSPSWQFKGSWNELAVAYDVLGDGEKQGETDDNGDEMHSDGLVLEAGNTGEDDWLLLVFVSV